MMCVYLGRIVSAQGQRLRSFQPCVTLPRINSFVWEYYLPKLQQ